MAQYQHLCNQGQSIFHNLGLCIRYLIAYYTEFLFCLITVDTEK